MNYDASNWALLIKQLKKTPNDINVLNRAQLIDDSFNLARADMLHYRVPLDLATYLNVEEDPLPWYSAMNSYSYLLERMRRNETEYSYFRVRRNISSHYLLNYFGEHSIS